MAKDGIIQNLLLNIASNTSELTAGLKQAQSKIDSFTGNITKLATGIGVAFGVKEVLNFGLEVSKLAAKSAGVKESFDKLPGSIKLMNDLKKSTSGMVSELELMTRANQAKEFNIDLQQLPKFMAFAASQAKKLGADTGFFTESLISGVAKGSKMVLDNLGLSSKQLSIELEKTGGDYAKAVGNIIDSMGDLTNATDTNITKTQRLGATWENAKVWLGNALNSTGLLGGAIDALSGSIELATSSNLSFWEKLGAFFSGPMGAVNAAVKHTVEQNKKIADETKKHEQVIREVDRAYKEFNGDLDAYAKTIQTHVLKTELITEFTKRLLDVEKKRAEGIENIANLEKKRTELQALQQIQSKDQIAATNIELQQIDEKIKKLKELGLEEIKLHNISKITKGQQAYEDQLKGANSGSMNKPATMGESFTSTSGVENVADITSRVMGEATAKINEHNEAVAMAQQGYVGFGEELVNWGGVAGGAFQTIGDGFVDMAMGMKVSWAEVVKSILAGIAKLLIAKLAESMANAIASGFSSGGNPIIGIALAAAGVAGALALFSRIPKFEKGGMHSGGWALVGERGPEAVNLGPSRIYKHTDTAKMFSNGGSGTMQLRAIITADQLEFLLEEGSRRRR